MKIISLILTFVAAILGCASVHADVNVRSSYAMVLSLDEIQSLFQKIQLSGQESYQLPDFLIEQPFKTQLQGVSLSGNYDAKMNSTNSVLSFGLTAKMSDLKLTVQKISTDAIIKKVVGGVNVEIFLKGYCENVEIKSLDVATMTASVHVATEATGLSPQLSAIGITALPQWDIHMGQCTGPLGYDKALQAEIRNILSNKEEMQKIITGPMATKLKTVASLLNEKIMAAHEMVLAESAKVTLKPDSLALISGTHFLLSGVVTAHLKSSMSGEDLIDDTAFAERLAAVNTTGVYFSQKWARAATMKAQELKLLNYSFTSSSIEALKSLFSSRLFQFFLWPDLMRFAKNVLFKFDLRLEKISKLAFVGSNDGALWYDFSGAGKVNTQAPNKSEYLHYGDFGSLLSSKVWIKIHKGAAVVGAYNPKFELQFSWAKKYLAIFNPFKSISTSYFAGKIQSTLKDEKYSFAVPKIPVSDGVEMRSSAISGDADILFLRYTSK